MNNSQGNPQNQTIPLNIDQFCAVSLINNLGQDIFYQLGPNNTAAVSQQLLNANLSVNFNDNLIYNILSY